MDEALFSFLSGILTIVGTTIAVSNYLNSRFSHLTSNMSDLITEQAVDSVQLREKLEHLEYRINSNTELINHRTSRFQKEAENLEELTKERDEAIRMQVTESRVIVLDKVKRMETLINQIQSFLARSSGYQIRGD